MDLLLMTDNLTSAAARGLGFANLILLRRSMASVSLSEPSTDQSPPASSPLQISTAIFPPVQSNSCKTLPRRILRKRRSTRRISFSGDDSDGVGDYAPYGDDSAGGYGPFDGGSGFYGGGSGGWSFGGYGSDDSSSRSHPGSRFAFDFIYEVICWIALSNCVHFAFKKVVRIAADVVADAGRGKVPIRLTAMC
ncbi:uncharacterized protein LOC116206582 [Punica granatum]|uniref:Uncharacterized protein LOC116206582 n=1 Tax=Punica granatum TaxID=22663 RepID=A0A218XTK0_PUNGR|nr:uncharacterized protein LOC116206582 [Punica granatum]OWM88138.1 hypothetical protein CDL15_Pgr016711 [Punica granatum]